MYREMFYGRHTALHQLQWRQIKIKNEFLSEQWIHSQVKTVWHILVDLIETNLLTVSFMSKLPNCDEFLIEIQTRPRSYAWPRYPQV